MASSRLLRCWQLMAVLLLTGPLPVLAQVDLSPTGFGRDYLATQVGDPLYQSIGVFTTFVYAVCGMIALFGAYRIYVRWQSGEDDVTWLIGRWVGAIMMLLAVTGFMGDWFAGNMDTRGAGQQITRTNMALSQIGSPLPPGPITPVAPPTYQPPSVSFVVPPSVPLNF
jgi:hypothetical protein